LAGVEAIGLVVKNSLTTKAMRENEQEKTPSIWTSFRSANGRASIVNRRGVRRELGEGARGQ
jgi:hypothetical protein